MAKNNKMLADIDTLIHWLELRNDEIAIGKTNVTEEDMPMLARVICGGETEVNKLAGSDKARYAKYFKENKAQTAALTLAGTGAAGMSIGAIASGVCTSGTIAGLSAGASAAGLAFSGAGALGMGALACVPALWPIGISMLALGAGSLFAKAKRNKEIAAYTEKLEAVFNSSHAQAQKDSEKIKDNNKKIQYIISQKIKQSVEALDDASKKIRINIDDALHGDQNLRIMQYQEIVLKQYNSQNEIRQSLADLVEAYNKLVAENEELARRVASYEANMRMSGCANNYL